MPRPNQDQINTQDKVRFFYQLGGGCVENPVNYGGVDGQYINIEDVTNPVRSIDTISVGDPKKAGRYRRIARNRSSVDYPTASVQLLQYRGFYPPQFAEFRTKPVTFYAVVGGGTADLSDFIGGWDQYVKILSYGEATEPKESLGSWDSGEQIQDDIDFTLEAVYNIGPIGFGERAAVEVYSEVVDVCYGSLNDGYTAVYSVSNNVVASVGQAPSITYRTKKNGDWTSLDITGAVSTDVPKAIHLIGKYIVVLFDDGSGGGYFYSELNTFSGIPGTFSKITTGFVSGGEPQDMFSPNTRSTFICGDAGYLYKLKSVSGGVEVIDAGLTTSNNLSRISGTDTGRLVAVGASDTIIFSEDRGKSWTTATTATGGAGTLTALDVVSEGVWWVGDGAGKVYYTIDRGETWTIKAIDPDFATIQDIKFVTDEVVYILGATSTPAAKIWTSWNGGEDWTSDRNRILSTPTADRFNRIRFPEETEPSILANWAVIGGLAGNGTDGLVLEMSPNTF